jgi:hypothetical protein
MIEQEKKPRMKGGLLAGMSCCSLEVIAHNRLYGSGKDIVVHRGYCWSSVRGSKSQDYPSSGSSRFA